jgi:hypothetical protein
MANGVTTRLWRKVFNSPSGVIIVDTLDEHPTKSLRRGMLGFEYNHRTGISDAVELKDIRLKRLSPGAQ